MKHFHHTTLFFKHKIFSASVFNDKFMVTQTDKFRKIIKICIFARFNCWGRMKNEVTGHEDDYKRKLAGTIDSLLHDLPHGLERYRISQVLHGNSST